MNKHFDIRELIKENPNTRLFDIVGQGGVGKSYSTKKLVLQNFFSNDEQFIYVRRWTTEIANDNLQTVFEDIEDDKEVMQWWHAWADEKYPYFHVLPKKGWFWIFGERANGTLDPLKPIGRPVALSKAGSFKGGTYNNFSVVWFDEFITDERYVGGDNEPNKLDKIVNTVGRAENDILVICCGNPDNFIEMCPYTKSLQLDYEHLQPNTAYLYDRKSAYTGKILANNVLFIKLANYSGGMFLNERTANLWDTPEGEMRISGEVKTNKYMSITDELEKASDPIYELVIETGVQSNTEYNRKIYAYVVETPDDGIGVLIKRHRSERLREACDWSVFCRYNEMKLRRHDSDLQILRLRIPNGPELAPLKMMLDQAESGRLYYADDDQVGTLFEAIRDYDR